MKNIIVLTSVLLGGNFLAIHTSSSSSHGSVVAREMKRFNASDGPVGPVSIIIDKSDYELTVYDEKGWYATYPVVFGNNSLEDKKVAGDKNTPEGVFHITSKRIHEKWDRFLAIDYPTKESWDKFNRRKQTGEIPANASIGGGVGIHGTWPHEDFVIDKYQNWTLGCISMKRDDVEEIYNYTPIGTQVTIRK
ncbi:MAG: L,D-transpeptidase [Bacteroidota bacterium]|nr:L,D-transpeptidase [Bacteroidota bacterium]